MTVPTGDDRPGAAAPVSRSAVVAAAVVVCAGAGTLHVVARTHLAGGGPSGSCGIPADCLVDPDVWGAAFAAGVYLAALVVIHTLAAAGLVCVAVGVLVGRRAGARRWRRVAARALVVTPPAAAIVAVVYGAAV